MSMVGRQRLEVDTRKLRRPLERSWDRERWDGTLGRRAKGFPNASVRQLGRGVVGDVAGKHLGVGKIVFRGKLGWKLAVFKNCNKEQDVCRLYRFGPCVLREYCVD